MTRFQDDYEELIAYIEGSLDELAAVRLEKRLAESASLRAEYAWLKNFFADAEVLRPANPRIDVVNDVLARIKVMAVGVDYAALSDYVEQCEEVPPPHHDLPLGEPGKPAERQWMAAFIGGCRELQKEHARRVPRVECVDEVLALIEKSRAQGSRVASWGQIKSSRKSLKSVGWLVAAAAAIVLLASYVFFRMDYRAGEEPARISVTKTNATGASSPKKWTSAQLDQAYTALRERVKQPWQTSTSSKAVFEAVAAPKLDALKPETVVATWRKVSSDSTAWGKIRQWATLTTEQARDIFAAKQHMPEAVAGAAVALLPEQREIALVTVIGRMPEDPAVRFSLAKSYATAPERSTAAIQTLNEVESLDKENALPMYVEARVRLESGDVAGALAVLEQAAELSRASAYALRSAQFREQALIASGMSPETARLLTAMTAGMDEYDFLCQLGNDLLQYGRYYAENGDTQTAESIYRSVQRLGQQLNAGADFLPEQMAALDVERQAVVLMQDLYTALGAEDGVEALTNQALDLIGRIEGLEGFTQAIEDFLAATTDINMWLNWAEALLGSGVKPLFDMFRRGSFNVREFIDVVAAPKSLLTVLKNARGL